MSYIIISGTEKDLIDVMARARIIEDLLREHKLRYIKFYTYDGCQDMQYKERRIYNQAGEFINFDIQASEDKVNFIWHLYNDIYSQMMNISLSFRAEREDVHTREDLTDEDFHDIH